MQLLQKFKQIMSMLSRSETYSCCMMRYEIFMLMAIDPATTDCLSDLADAKDRLSYVVESTEKAANKTMDLVDECVPIASDYVRN